VTISRRRSAEEMERFQVALARLEQTIQQVLAETRMTEEELARLFDLNEPLPEETSGSDG